MTAASTIFKNRNSQSAYSKLSILNFPLFSVFVFLLVFSENAVAQETAILQLIQQRYNSIQSFSGHFVQTGYRAESDTAPKKAEGTVSYKRPGKMRWVYETPEDQLLVTNGETLWLFDPLLENVTIQKLEKITEGTALAFLLGAGDLRSAFYHRKISQTLLERPEGLVVELKPQKESANLAFIQLEVHPETYDLQKIALMDRQGNYRTIALEAMRYNLTLEDSDFEFEITPEMEVIEAGD